MKYCIINTILAQETEKVLAGNVKKVLTAGDQN